MAERKPKKERKWERFKDQLPKFQNESTYQDKINKRKQELLQGSKDFEKLETNPELGTFLAANKYRKAELEEELKEIELSIESIQQILTERFENDGIQSIRLASGELLYLTDTPYSSVEDAQKVKVWFVEHEMAEMLTVQWMSLNAIVKERLESGQPVPDGVKVFMKTTVAMRKG